MATIRRVSFASFATFVSTANLVFFFLILSRRVLSWTKCSSRQSYRRILFLRYEINFCVFKFHISYLSAGKLHRPSEVCANRFTEELQFWRLEKTEVRASCWIVTRSAKRSSFQFAPCCAPSLRSFGARKNLAEEEREFQGVREDDFHFSRYCIYV